jgi:polyphenol oxidase
MNTKAQPKKDLAAKALAKNDWPLVENNGLTLLFSPLLSEYESLIHAFTTRKGGESQKPLDSFNLGKHWSTEKTQADAIKNRKRLCEIFALPFENLIVPHQVHSRNIAWITELTDLPETDGAATVDSQFPLLLQFADCVPVILFDKTTEAVCVVHAGWRGTAAGISAYAANMLASVLNSQTSEIVAAIGPAIGSCCYPTGLDVKAKLETTVSADSKDLVSWKDGVPHPDLQAFNALQLYEAGVSQVDVANRCTACQSEIFYSHRQSGGKTGRQGALAAIKKRAHK